MSGWTNCCRGRRSACPTVKLEQGKDNTTVFIKDDFGHTIELNEEQFGDVVHTVHDLLAKSNTQSVTA